MSDDFLKTVVRHKQSLLKEKKVFYENLKKNASCVTRNRYNLFKKSISKPGKINLIAEIKKASPSQGIIREDFDVAKIAKIYSDNKADAISVLTEEKYFLGKPAYLREVSEDFKLPTLMKDFIIDEYQVYEAFACQASAILLIVAILSDSQLVELMDCAHRLDMDVLVEIHDEKELERAVKAQAEIIGVNNRNLQTLIVDLKVSESLLGRIPKDKIIVAESGIKTHEDVKRLKNLGAHAVLIGETFMRSPDIGRKLKEVFYGQS